MKQEKKCDGCGEWTPWTGLATDRCLNCNTPLDTRTVDEVKAWVQRIEEDKKNDFFTQKETDGPFMIATRKVAFFFHMIFGGIAWIFIWAFASTPG